MEPAARVRREEADRLRDQARIISELEDIRGLLASNLEELRAE